MISVAQHSIIVAPSSAEGTYNLELDALAVKVYRPNLEIDANCTAYDAWKSSPKVRSPKAGQAVGEVKVDGRDEGRSPRVVAEAQQQT